MNQNNTIKKILTFMLLFTIIMQLSVYAQATNKPDTSAEEDASLCKFTVELNPTPSKAKILDPKTAAERNYITEHTKGLDTPLITEKVGATVTVTADGECVYPITVETNHPNSNTTEITQKIYNSTTTKVTIPEEHIPVYTIGNPANVITTPEGALLGYQKFEATMQDMCGYGERASNYVCIYDNRYGVSTEEQCRETKQEIAHFTNSPNPAWMETSLLKENLVAYGLSYGEGYIKKTLEERKFRPDPPFTPLDDWQMVFQLKKACRPPEILTQHYITGEWSLPKPNSYAYMAYAITTNSKGDEIIIDKQPITIYEGVKEGIDGAHYHAEFNWWTKPLENLKAEQLIESISQNRKVFARIELIKTNAEGVSTHETIYDGDTDSAYELPVTNCAQIYGEGSAKIITQRAKSSAYTPADLVDSILRNPNSQTMRVGLKEIIEEQFEYVNTTMGEKFAKLKDVSMYVDLGVINDSYWETKKIESYNSNGNMWFTSIPDYTMACEDYSAKVVYTSKNDIKEPTVTMLPFQTMDGLKTLFLNMREANKIIDKGEATIEDLKIVIFDDIWKFIYG